MYLRNYGGITPLPDKIDYLWSLPNHDEMRGKMRGNAWELTTTLPTLVDPAEAGGANRSLFAGRESNRAVFRMGTRLG